MGNVLTYCEHSGDKLRGSALSALTAARELAAKQGGQVVAVVIGKGAAAAAVGAKNLAPKFITVEDPRLETVLAETYAPVLARVAREVSATGVVAAASNLGKDLMPRVATMLEAGMASDISAVVSANQFKRPILAGNAIATVEIGSPVVVVTARQSEFSPAAALGSDGEVVSSSAGDVNALGAECLGVSVSKSERPELTDAKIIVSGGRGMKSGENFKHLEELADTMGAAVGASRAATDAGFVPADFQIGQTGKVVAPDLYFAIAISGAIQHLAGMKGSRVIVAVNKDPEAPIFQVADYGLVATWEQAVPQLTAEIKKHRAAQH